MGCVPVQVEVKTKSKDGKEEVKKEEKVEVAVEKKEVVNADGSKTTTVTKTETKTVEVNNEVNEVKEVKEEKQEVKEVQEVQVVKEEKTETKVVEYQEKTEVKQEVVEEKVEKVEVVEEVEAGGDPEDDAIEADIKINDMTDSIDFPVTGKWTYNGKDEDMNITSTKLGENGRIKCIGSDSLGNFEMKGKFNKDAKVIFIKTYADGNKTIKLKGTYEDDKITGSVKGGKGDFELVFNLPKKYEASTNILRINDEEPMIGILNSVARGWGFITAPKKIGAEEANIKAYFVDGNQESISTKLDENGFISMQVGSESEMYFAA
jgi:hypothetical protein